MRWPILIYCLLGLTFAGNAKAAISVTPGAPESFKALETPRTTSVTLFYGGEMLGNFPAAYTPTSLSFTTPKTLLDALHNLSDAATVGEVISNPMPTHPELLCGTKNPDGCGKLTPQIAGIIFDEDHLAAELFINPAYLSVSEQNDARFLPLPERNFSSVYRFEGAINGTDQQSPNYAIANNNLFAFGEGNIATGTTITNRGLRFDTVRAEVDREGFTTAGGLMRSSPMQLARDVDIIGASIGTSLRTRLDVRKTEGNDIILFLPRQSFVSIYRDGRLYASRTYEAGNQKIDTSELPDGAYNITLKIQEIGGGMREETRFFAKSEQLPPPDAPTYYLQGGLVRKAANQDGTLPEFTSKPILRTGTVRRVSESTGLGVGLLGLDDRAVVETSGFLITNGTQFRATALGSTAGDFGAQMNAQYVSPDWNANVDLRKLWSGQDLSTDYNGILDAVTQASASINFMATPALTLSARANYSDSPNMPATASFGPAVTYRIWQEGESMLYFTADAARSDGQYQGTAIMRFSYRLGDYGVSAESGQLFGSGSPGAYGSGRVWRDKTTDDGQLILGGNLRTDAHTQNIGADADWRNSVSHLRGSVMQSMGTNSGTSYGGNIAIGAAQTDDMVTLGGSDADSSAVIVETSGDADTDMTIFVNGTPRSRVKVGEHQTLYLTPYTTYRIRVAPSKGGLMHVEGAERKVTLYPGNVVRLNWQVDRFNVIAARIVNEKGEPLAGALLQEGKNNLTTDGKGRIQAELVHPKQLTFTTTQNTQCIVDLPKEETASNGVLIYHQPLTCH